MTKYTLLILIAVLTFACKKKDPVNDDQQNDPAEEPQLIFKVKIDGDQVRLDNLGQPASIPEGNAAQTPRFNFIAAHYIELTESAFVQVGNGAVLYHAPETEEGGSKAIDFHQSNLVQDGEIMFSIPLSQVATGTYEYARVSIAYQNYEIDFRASGFDLQGTIASFVGYNTYIKSHAVKDLVDEVNGNKLQGYWAFETHGNEFFPSQLTNGQAPGTTVPNPIAGTSPIPPGSCLVTGEFENNLVITGNETKDVIVELSFSVNNSFEWEDPNENGIFEPQEEEKVVDMGLRGLIPRVLD